jgi:hypothetical protein
MKVVALTLLLGVLASSCANVECSFNSDCGEHARCELNRCMRDCLEDRDCEQGSTCNPNGFCIKPTPTEDHPEVIDAPVSVDRGNTPVDVGFDVGTDVGFDAGTDVGTDVGFDVGFDVGTDVGTDAGFDVGFDVGTDAGFDVGRDIGTDVGFDAGTADAPVGPAAVGVYEYTGVRPGALVSPVAAAWHPSGSYALILSASNTVFRYDAAMQSVAQVASAGSTVSWRGLSFTPDGSRALLLGNTGSGTAARGRIFVWDHASSMLAERTTETYSPGTYQSLRWSPDGRRGVMLASGTSSLTIWRYDASGARTGVPMGYGLAPMTGCSDLAWVTDGFGDPALMVVCGTNTAQILSVTGLDSASPAIMSLMPVGGIGNVGRIAARAQGDVALTVGYSGQRLYRYRAGVWSAGFSAPQVIGAFGVSFSSDGARALAFGALGRAYEYRYELFTSGDITDVRMPDLTAAPYTQPSTAQLNDVAWRPGCHEGLAVGGSNTFSGTTAFVAYFRVLNGVRCN